MDLSDIEKTSPQALKQNMVTNIRDNKIDVKDIDRPQAVKFKTNRISDPLDPTYKMQTASRRHIMTLGKIDGNAPKQHKSPETRRLTNITEDIAGAQAKDHRTIPPEKKQLLQESVYELYARNGNRLPPIPRPNKPVYDHKGTA